MARGLFRHPPNIRQTEPQTKFVPISGIFQNASAGVAAATGLANSSSIKLQPNAGNAAATVAVYDERTGDLSTDVAFATATGTAFTADAAPGVSATADVGLVTVTAYDALPQFSVATIVDLTATGANQWTAGTVAAGSPIVNIQSNAENAAGTGTAYDATDTVAPTAGVGAAAGTVAAAASIPTLTANAGVSTGTGAAGNAADNVAPNAGNAAGTGTAYSTALGNASPTASTGTGAAYAATLSIAPTAGNGAGTGTAYDATVKVSASVAAAAAIGAAYAAAASVAVSAGVATGTGAAYSAAKVNVALLVAVATATGTAYNSAGSAGVVSGHHGTGRVGHGRHGTGRVSRDTGTGRV